MMKSSLSVLALLLVMAVQCTGEPKPQQERVPMLDGTKLVTDVYLPGDGAYPVMLLRSTYGRKLADVKDFMKRGYALVIQDVRGMGESEGEKRVFYADGWRPDQQDGKDTVDWIRKQKWCNGTIGTTGGSALAITQLLMAPATNGVKFQAIEVGGSNFYGNLAYQGGVFEKNLCEGWLAAIKQPHMIEFWKSHPACDEFWSYYNMELQAPKITASALHIGGWYDIFQKGSINNFLTRQENGGPGAKGQQWLIMKWSPHGPDTSPDFTYSENRFDLHVGKIRDMLMDYELKGTANGADKLPAVYYYVYGDDKDLKAPGMEWRTATTWPPVAATATSFFLGQNGALDAAAGTDNGPLTFVYDPANPVPTNGGNNLLIPSGPYDQRKTTEGRTDVLKFATAPLTEPLEIDGNVRVKLFVSTDAPDTDFTGKLIDVCPDGREILMLDNIQRVKFRKTFAKPEPLLTSADEVVEVEIDMWDLSWVFNAGHRIGVQISSSNYPRFEKNPNTGDDFPKTETVKDAEGKDVTREVVRTAKNAVHIGAKYPSALVLPVRNLDVDDNGNGLTVRQEWAKGDTKVKIELP